VSVPRLEHGHQPTVGHEVRGSRVCGVEPKIAWDLPRRSAS
jgi:hypothetical protein